jgi:hypothetical protein
MHTSTEWRYRFSRRTSIAERSIKRELMPQTTRPDVMSFAGGPPAPDLFPVGIHHRDTKSQRIL